MTTFETQIYKKEAENIIGAQVIVSSNNGQNIDSIQVTNKTQFDNLVAKLDTLNEDYTQFDEDSPLKGLTLDSILANEDETVNINALTLNGLQSDQFSKANHNHYKATILDLYTYDISLSKYNASPGENITVTVKVTDTKGSPVKNNNVIIYVNNTSWKTGTTNVNGIFTTTYNTGSTEGLITFQVANQRVQCNVHYDTGWVNAVITNSALFKASGSPPCQVRRIGNTVHVRGAVTSITTMENFNAGWDDYTNIFQLPDSRFYPRYTETYVVQASKKQRCTVQVTTNGAVWVGRFTDASSSGVYNLPKNLWISVSLTYFVG